MSSAVLKPVNGESISSLKNESSRAIASNYVDMIPRKCCALSLQHDLEPLFTLPSFPVSMYCVDTLPETDIFADMEWSISRGSGCVQLAKLAPLDVVYGHEHGSGAVGGVWRDHHSAFANFLNKHGVRRALEIGAGHGVLAKQYLEHYQDASWVVVEPNLPAWAHERVLMIKGMFGSDFTLPDGVPSVDAVVHSHTFEHMYEPRAFLEDVNKFLPEGAMHVFTLPRMGSWLKQHHPNTLNFEHTILLTENAIEELLRVTGFEIVEKQCFRNDHSVFYATRKVAAFSQLAALRLNEFTTNKKMFMDFVTAQQEAVSRINTALAQVPGKAYLFGAHIFSQITLGFGLHVDRIAGIIDNDASKHGKRLYGTNLIVSGPEVLSTVEHPVVVLRVGSYRREIMDGIVKCISPRRVIFLE